MTPDLGAALTGLVNILIFFVVLAIFYVFTRIF